MEVKTKISRDTNLRIHKISGRFELRELLAELKRIYSSPDFDPKMNSLWDLRETDLSAFTSAEIETVRDFVSGSWGADENAKSALVVSKEVDFGLSRMYEVMLEDKVSSQVHIFRDYDKALAWIQE